MRKTDQLFRLINEIVFVLLGAFLLWVAFTGHYIFLDARQISWIVLAGVLVAWGVWESSRARRTQSRGERAALRIGGGSLVIVGVMMMSLGWVPIHWSSLLLAGAGAIFMVRGFVIAAIMAWMS